MLLKNFIDKRIEEPIIVKLKKLNEGQQSYISKTVNEPD